MGGMIVLHYAIHRKNDVSLTGVLSSAPAVEVAEKSQPNCLVLNAAKIAARILPTFPKKTGLGKSYV
jgi:alpha-beta hydrolase superfamily lysophospholipase